MERGRASVPHFFTLANAFFGFLAVIFAAHGEYSVGAYCILMGALMDALDGRIARFMGLSTPFGVELDSLCDAISFCLAPAFLVYSWQLHKMGVFGVAIAAFYLCLGVVRLARFNVIHTQQSGFFMGLPTTIAGCFLATLLLNFKGGVVGTKNILCVPVIVIVLAILMVSKMPFPTFKQPVIFLDAVNRRRLILSLVAVVAIMGFNITLALFFCAYFLYAFWEAARMRLTTIKGYT